jgi:predicted acetyltransferase
MHKLTGMEPSPITADEIPGFVEAVDSAFHHEVVPADVERIRRKLEPERTLVIRDGEQIVAGTSIYSRRMTVPGGEVPVAGVTQVGVVATHRRRGLLTSLMRRQLADVHELGRESIAALWASESVIYGRFGYGVASLVAELEVATREAELRALPAAQARLLKPADAVDAMRAIHDVARLDRPGMLDRDGPWWDVRIHDAPEDRDGFEPLRAVVFDGIGYALYSVKMKFEHGRPAGEVAVREALAVTPEGQSAVWGFLLGLDLTRRLVYELAAPDEPLPHMVTNAHAVDGRLNDSLWVRLVDVPRALRERSYAAPFEVVLEVADEICPWNAGRYALRWDGEAATCAPTATPPGLELGAAELGAAFLGGTTLDVLARAGRVRELRSGALAAASRGFQGDRAPWCPEIF